MRQLTPVDASFLSMELPNAPMHVGSLAIYDPATAPGGKIQMKKVLEQIETKALGIPSMTEVLKHLPLDIDHPYWVNGGQFDTSYHIRHLALPKPGNWQQLCEEVARIHARPLDRAHPLWKIYIIEGLDNLPDFPKGCFAMLSKVHHASIDGSSGGDLSSALHELSAKPKRTRTKQSATVDAEQEPNSMSLLLRAQVNNLKAPIKYLRVVRESVPKISRTAAGLVKGDLKRIKNVPRTRFSGQVSPQRVFNSVRLKLEDIRDIKNAVEGATINDVALSIVGGGLRQYLLSKDELPEHSMVGAVPINLRTEENKDAGGNEVSNMSVALRTDIADPLERLEAIHQGTQEAKAFTQSIGPSTMTDYIQMIPSAVTGPAVRISERLNMTERVTPMYNCSVTNVPGPRVPLYFQGAKMLINYGMGPVMNGVGIFNIINSYCDEFSISFTSCRKMIPDPEFYAECIQNTFDELYAATVN